MKKSKSILLAMLLLALGTATLAAASLGAEQDALSGRLIRLHVVAASDAPVDQARKLMVRDRVLAYMDRLDCADRADAERQLRLHLADIRRTAADALRADGCAEQVSVTLREEAFPTRQYDTFALPAGNYLSLRVNIGAHEGHNWWCVVYPSICTAASEVDFRATAAAGGFTEEDMAIIRGDKGGYVIKFKLIELIETLRNSLQDT